MLKQRIRVICMNGGANSELLLLLNSENFADFLANQSLAKSLSAKDKVRLLPALNIPMDALKKAVSVIKTACEKI